MDRKACVLVATTFGLYASLCGQSKLITGSIQGFSRNDTYEMIPQTAIIFRHWEHDFFHTSRSSLSGIQPGWDIGKQKEIIRNMQNKTDQEKHVHKHTIGPLILTQFALHEIQKALNQDEVILEYVLQEPSSMCVAISRESVQRAKLVSGYVIESNISAYREEILKGRQGSQIARRLYDLLLAPIAGFEQKRRITIIPGGQIHLLPFEALIAPSGDYVINAHMINYSPSAAVALLNRKVLRNPDRHNRLLAVADPRSPSPKAMRSALFAGVSESARLYGARMEVLSIANSLKGATETVTLLGNDASEAAIKAMNMAEFNILHFAVHGIHDTNYLAGSALVLGSHVDETEDGILQAWEISRMQLKADLVVLSACDTAVGKPSGQDGISDLVQAFLLAGSRTVVGSIWPAEDRSTAHLIACFYGYLARGMDKGSALRQAKLDFIEKYKTAALPILWAGMVMIGDSSDSIIDSYLSFFDARKSLVHFGCFN